MLQGTIERIRGNCPVILSVLHDGELTYLNNRMLPFNENSKRRDTNTADIARRVASYMQVNGLLPTLIVQNVKRQHLTQDINSYFIHIVTEEARSIQKAWGRAFVGDFHGFGVTDDEFLKRYDLVFGTRHRKT